MNVEISGGAKKKSLIKRIKAAFLRWFRLTNQPVVKLYTGYANSTSCYIYGHVFSLSPLPRRRYRNFFLINTFALLRLFMVKVKPGAALQLTWDGLKYATRSEPDGFFKFEWKPPAMPLPGSMEVVVSLLDDINGNEIATGKANLVIPYQNEFAFISDIDDTFLVSHSSNLRKRLFVLLTENAYSRKPFEGVVNHYKLLARAHTGAESINPFFYVSSSEWNLYNYIRDFSERNELPDGVYLLNQVKLFSQVFKTGQNNHATKFMRIARVLEAYPGRRFTLLGDDSQEDPNIYAAVAEHFKSQVYCIYIRKVGGSRKPAVEEKLRSAEKMGILCCYFSNSAEAVAHSKAIGLITSV